MEKASNKLKAFNDIYNSSYRKCFAFAKSYVHRNEVADDIASESMVKLWEQFDTIDNIQNIQAFLLTIVKNLCLNYLHREQLKIQTHDKIFNSALREIELRITSLESCNPEVLFSKEVSLIFEKTLAEFPEQTRKVFEMSRIEYMSNKEIAEALGITVKGVDYHISKAIKKLKISLKDYLPALLFLLY